MSPNPVAFPLLLCFCLLLTGPTAARRAFISPEMIQRLKSDGAPGFAKISPSSSGASSIHPIAPTRNLLARNAVHMPAKSLRNNDLPGSETAGSWLQQMMSTEADHWNSAFIHHSSLTTVFVGIALVGLVFGCIMIAYVGISRSTRQRANIDTISYCCKLEATSSSSGCKPEATSRGTPESETFGTVILKDAVSAASDQHSATQAVYTPVAASSPCSGDGYNQEPGSVIVTAASNSGLMDETSNADTESFGTEAGDPGKQADHSYNVTRVDSNHLTIPVPQEDLGYRKGSVASVSSSGSAGRKTTISPEWLSKLEERRKLLGDQADETDDV